MKKSNESIAAAFAQMKMEEEKEFKNEFKNAFDKLYNYKQKTESFKTLNEKAELLQSYMDEITQLLHNAKHNYNIYYDNFENDQMRLIDLRKQIESYINELYEAARSTSTIKETNQRGVKKIETKEFKEYIKKNWSDYQKTKFIESLKAEFTDINDKLANSSYHSFATLILVLIDREILYNPKDVKNRVTNKNIVESLINEFNSKPKNQRSLQNAVNEILNTPPTQIKEIPEYLSKSNKLTKISAISLKQ